MIETFRIIEKKIEGSLREWLSREFLPAFGGRIGYYYPCARHDETGAGRFNSHYFHAELSFPGKVMVEVENGNLCGCHFDWYP